MGLLSVDDQLFCLCQIVVYCFTGDQVSKNGSMTGGFYDHRRAKLKFMNIIKQTANNIHIREKELEQVKFQIQDIL
jgi:structural maintenance of chromosome 3 (chondroitin sulfate proteoglycan 6)